MSSDHFPHATTLSSSSSSQKRPSEPKQLPSQSRSGSASQSNSPSPPASSPQANHAIPTPNQNSIKHFYSPFLTSPPLGSSPASVVYSPLPSVPPTQVQSPIQPQQSRAPLPPPSSTPRSQSSQPTLQISRQYLSARQHADYALEPEQVHYSPTPFIPSSTSQNQNPPINPSASTPLLSTTTTATNTNTTTYSPNPQFQFPNFSSYSHPPSHNLSSLFSSPSMPCTPSISSSVSNDDDGINGMTWEQHEPELAVRRAKNMCTWFTGVLVAVLVGVGVVRWWVYA